VISYSDGDLLGRSEEFRNHVTAFESAGHEFYVVHGPGHARRGVRTLLEERIRRRTRRRARRQLVAVRARRDGRTPRPELV